MQLKKINSYTKIICDRFRKIGYNVPTVVCKVRDNYVKQNGDFYPLFTDENGKTIYIDIDAFEDLSKSKEAMMFYLPHEIAHIISNENHSGKKFNKCINDYNKHYKDVEILADPDDEEKYNSKYLPTFNKKYNFSFNVKTNKELEDGIDKETWNKS